jgi:hypothetical protein
MPDPSNNFNYSAELSLWIDCGCHGKVPLSQASETFVIASAPTVLPACQARIILSVDGFLYERPVQLVDGFSANSREARVLSDVDVSPF